MGGASNIPLRFLYSQPKYDIHMTNLERQSNIYRYYHPLLIFHHTNGVPDPCKFMLPFALGHFTYFFSDEDI